MKNFTLGARPYTWGHYRACDPHVRAPLHHWGNATREGITVHVSHTWAVHEGLPSTIEGMLHMRALPCTWATCEGLPSTIEGMLHVRALPCTWATHELYVRGFPATHQGITVHVSHTWAVREGLPSTIEEMLHIRALPCMWATRELYVRGSLSTTEGMLHMRALPCMWATRELYVRGSPPPLRECYMWGHYCAREPHVRGSPPPLRKCYMWGHYHACEPHVSCTWGAPLHHWGNATHEGITVHVSHTWLTCMHTAPLHLPKKVTKKQPVNHIGSSDEPPINQDTTKFG